MAAQGAIQARHMLMGRDDQTLGLGFFRCITLSNFTVSCQPNTCFLLHKKATLVNDLNLLLLGLDG